MGVGWMGGVRRCQLQHQAVPLPCAMQAPGGPKRWVWLMDMGTYSSANSPSLSMSRKFIAIVAQHFPERLHKAWFPTAHHFVALALTARAPPRALVLLAAACMAWMRQMQRDSELPLSACCCCCCPCLTAALHHRRANPLLGALEGSVSLCGPGEGWAMFGRCAGRCAAA